jgi:hypothetical protein
MTKKTGAERQAAWRGRRKAGYARRLGIWISLEAQVALERVARRRAMTQEQMVEWLIAAEDDRLLVNLVADTPDWDDYFAKPLRKRQRTL